MPHRVRDTRPLNPESNSHDRLRFPWLRHHRQRWLRHDAHLWIRPDAARFFPPGTDLADVYSTLPRKPDTAKAAAFEVEIEAGYRLLAVLREEVAELRAELKRRRELEAKYSPSQPRVPSGNPRGGQWTDRSGGGGSGGFVSGDGAEGGGSSEGSDDEGGSVGASSGMDSENFSDSIVKIAADDTDRRYSVNLQEEEARGGHTLRDHVGKTDDYLIGLMNADYERSTSGNLQITRFRDAEGSFATPEQANDNVNQLLKLERDKVDQVATGAEKRLTLESRIGSVTGYEAFRPNGDSDPYIRDTYGVRAVIVNDSRSPRGYTVRTAFPVNERPGRR
jgi:Bacterial CdiA-CT RNAse A domain